MYIDNDCIINIKFIMVNVLSSVPKQIFYLYSIFYILTVLLLYLLEYNNRLNLFYIPILLGLLIQYALYTVKGFRYESAIFTNWVRPSVVITLSLIVVNLQIVIDVLCGHDTLSNYLADRRYSFYLGNVLFFGCLGISSFLLGNSICIKKKRSLQNVNCDIASCNITLWVILALLSFILFIANIDVLSFYTGMNYAGSGASDRVSDASSRWETLFDAFSTIIICITTKNLLAQGDKVSVLGFIRAFPFVFIMISIAYLLLRLMSGDRGPVIYTLLMFFYSYILINKTKIKLFLFISLLLVGATTMNIVNTIRSYSSGVGFDERFARAINEFSDGESSDGIKTLCPPTFELAKSVNCNFIAIHDIDRGITDFQLGKYNFLEIVSAIPGLPNIINAYYNFDVYRFSTSEYVTISFFGKSYSIGLGTTALIDLYLDFGILGVMIGLFIIGIIYKKLDSSIAYGDGVKSLLFLIFFIKFSSMSIYIPRASIAFVLCKYLYICIIFTFFSTLFLIPLSIINKKIVSNFRRINL